MEDWEYKKFLIEVKSLILSIISGILYWIFKIKEVGREAIAMDLSLSEKLNLMFNQLISLILLMAVIWVVCFGLSYFKLSLDRDMNSKNV